MTNPVVNSDIELREPEILLPGSKYLWRNERDIGSCSFPQCHKKTKGKLSIHANTLLYSHLLHSNYTVLVN
jgi:hypothetical protein